MIDSPPLQDRGWSVAKSTKQTLLPCANVFDKIVLEVCVLNCFTVLPEVNQRTLSMSHSPCLAYIHGLRFCDAPW